MREGPGAMKELFASVQSRWTPQRAAEVEQQVLQGLARRRRRRVGVAAVSVLILAAGAARLLTESQVTSVIVRGELRAPIRLAEGSTITPLRQDAELEIVPPSERRQIVRIRHGGARFDVVSRPERLFRVESGDVAVEVLGTVFEVEESGGRVRVACDRGRVRILWPGGSTEIAAGGAGLFPPGPAPTIVPLNRPTAEPVDPADTPAEAPADTVEQPDRSGARSPRSSTWRSLAQRGRFDEAYRNLKREGPVADEPGALLAAADVARLSRHPAEAATRFREIVQRFPRDPRSSLAAFHLGLVLLEELGRPREAAVAFARCRSLDPGGDLVEDAHAREVEAWFRAGDAAAATERAEAYLRRYPQGHRAATVRGFGRLPARVP